MAIMNPLLPVSVAYIGERTYAHSGDVAADANAPQRQRFHPNLAYDLQFNQRCPVQRRSIIYRD